MDDGGKRPASVKASLSVALGQRAPNRAGAREEGRGLGAGLRGVAGPRRRSPSNDRIREQQPGPRRRSRSPYRRDAGRDDRDHRIDHFRHDRQCTMQIGVKGGGCGFTIYERLWNVFHGCRQSACDIGDIGA